MKDYNGMRLDDLEEMNSSLFTWENSVIECGESFIGSWWQDREDAWMLTYPHNNDGYSNGYHPVGYTKNPPFGRDMSCGITSWALMLEDDDGFRLWSHIYNPDEYNAIFGKHYKRLNELSGKEGECQHD